MTELTTTKTELGSYYLHTKTGVDVGVLVMDADGYYYYWPNLQNKGSWSSWMLRDVANILEEINKPWDDIVQADQSI